MFVVVWRGWGPIVIAIGFLALLVGFLVTSTLGFDERGGDFIVGLALIAAGIGTWFLGVRMNRDAVRDLVDPKTGEQVTVRGGHSLFFVSVRWWGVVMIAFGLYMIVIGVIGAPQV